MRRSGAGTPTPRSPTCQRPSVASPPPTTCVGRPWRARGSATLYATGLGNLTAGKAWFARARRILEAGPPCLEQGWVAVAAHGVRRRRPRRAARRAPSSPSTGPAGSATSTWRPRRSPTPGWPTSRRAVSPTGMALLDEAMALACGPADDRRRRPSRCARSSPPATTPPTSNGPGRGPSCSAGTASSARTPGGPAFLSAHCDSVQATLLIELGRWSEAEAVLVQAKADFEAIMHRPSSWHPDIALADLRVRQGRLAEAEALLLGKDQAIQALLPAARLHLARGDHDLARADRPRVACAASATIALRAAELLTVLVDAELGRGDAAAATAACARAGGPDGRPRRPGAAGPGRRGAGASARRRRGRSPTPSWCWSRRSTASTPARSPGCALTLLLQLAGLRDHLGDTAAATVDAKAAAALLASLDVVLDPVDAAAADAARSIAPRDRWPRRRYACDGKWWQASFDGSTVRLPDTKGLRYLAELIARAGAERHALDLVDRVEGVAADGGPDRRALGDAGELLDGRAREAYRRPHRAVARRRRRGARCRAAGDGRGGAGRARPAGRPARPGLRPRRPRPPGGLGRRAGPPQRHPGGARGDRQARPRRCRRPDRRSTGASAPASTASTSPPTTSGCAGSFSPD